MKFPLKPILSTLFTLAVLTSCTKDKESEPNPQPSENNLILINSVATNQGGMEVSLYAEDSLMAEYTPLYIQVKDATTGDLITHADITIEPMMVLDGMTHAAPSENPPSTAIDNKFEGAVVFTMPSEMGWVLEVNIYDPANDRLEAATLPVAVKAPAKTRVIVASPLDGSDPLIISYLQPQTPEIGINDFEITVHRQESMMDFTPVSGLTVEVDPEMLAMGHGSPNNVNPTHSQSGHYTGKVNFTMSGDWRINLTLLNGQTVIDSTAYFDVTF